MCLELTQDLPSEAELDRWFGEPIKSVMLPTSLFLMNRKGYPVLSVAHQKAMFKLFRVKYLQISHCTLCGLFITAICLLITVVFLSYQ